MPGLLEEDLGGSLYALVRERYGLRPVARVPRQELEPTPLDSGAAAMLGVRPDVPALRVTRTAWDAKGRAIEFAQGPAQGRPYDLGLRNLNPGQLERFKEGVNLMPPPQRLIICRESP